MARLLTTRLSHSLFQNKQLDFQSLSWAVFNQSLLSIGAVVIVLALSSFLSPVTFGGIRYLVAVFAILSFFSLPGVAPVIIHHLPSLSRRGLWHGIITQVRWGLGATIGSLLIGAYYLGFNTVNSDLAFAFLIGGFLAPITNLYLMPGTVLAGLKRFRTKALVDGSVVALAAAGAAYGAWITQTITGAILFYYVVQSLATVVALVFIARILPIHVTEPYHRPKTDTRYGKQLTLFQVPFTLLPSLEKALVFILLGPAALAVFAITVIPMEHMKNSMRNLLQFYVLPHLKNPELKTGMFSIKRWFLLSVALSAVATAILVFAVLLLMPIFFPHYQEAHRYAVILGFTILFLPFQVFTISWIATQRVETLLLYALSIVLINVLAFVILLPSFGFQGAIVAKIVSESLASIIAGVFHIDRNGGGRGRD